MKHHERKVIPFPTPEEIAESLGSHTFRYVDLDNEVPADVIPLPIKEEPEDLIA